MGPAFRRSRMSGQVILYRVSEISSPSLTSATAPQRGHLATSICGRLYEADWHSVTVAPQRVFEFAPQPEGQSSLAWRSTAGPAPFAETPIGERVDLRHHLQSN